MKSKLKEMFSILIWFVIAILLCSLFGSCSTQKTATSEIIHLHDTVLVNKTSIDTLIQKDSVYHEVIVKGDTVRIKDYVLKYIYKPRVEYKDSIVYVNKLIDRNITKEVEKYTTFWQRIKSTLNGFLFLIIIAVIGWLGWKLGKRLIL